MKKSLLTLPMLGLLAVGCTSNEPGVGNEGVADAEVTGYLAIGVLAPGGISTRADYQYGTASENYVGKIRFFFFDEEGDPAMVRKNPITENEYYSYYDWDPTTADNNGATGTPGTNVTNPTPDPEDVGMATVEKVLSTTLALSVPEGADNPYSVVAVLNPSNDVLNIPNPSLSDLRLAVYDFESGLVDRNFVMSNSVYMVGSGEQAQIMYTQPIADTNYQKTLELAQKNPLYIYVERVVARLDLTIDEELPTVTVEETGETLYDIDFNFTPLDPYPDGAPASKYNQTPIYAKFLGWRVTSTPNASQLEKEINPNWTSSLFGVGDPWNSADFHRSFWAMNYEGLEDNLEENYIWYSYNDLTGFNNTPMTGLSMATTKTYMQENANPYDTGGEFGANPNPPTSVIIAAQLCEEDGTPVTIAEYNQQYYTIDGLKNLAAHNLDLYYKDENGKYQPITYDMLSFMTSTAYTNEQQQTTDSPIGHTGNYISYFTLDPETTEGITTWYHLNANTAGKEDQDASYTQVTGNMDKYLYDALGVAMVWNNGYTYYYFDIRHLTTTKDAPAYLGVVRNHIYDCTVNAIAGLGTPVWDPKEDIDPEKPNREGNLLTAQIRILMWRLVSQDYDLSW